MFLVDCEAEVCVIEGAEGWLVLEFCCFLHGG